MHLNLPLCNATLNGISGVFLLIGWLLIRNNHTRPHIVMMSCALVSSTLFLTGYIANHIIRHGVVTKFTAEGVIRPVYYTLLISHTFLAMVTVPLVLCTVIPALKARFDKHRRIGRWTFPIWLYVSVTGVLVYLMLYRWYPPSSIAMR
jgi:uncharacterized membrane protein YozB (DUF420 family)